jgi:hypothetical protein
MSAARSTREDPADGRLRYVLIASNAYSGSTLLSYLLGQHPQVATVSDVSGARRQAQMATYPCSCGLAMQACSFWQRVVELTRERGVEDFELGNFRLGFDSSDRRWLERLRIGSLRWGGLEDLRDLAFRAIGAHRVLSGVAARNLAFAGAVLEATGARVFVDASKERMRLRYLQRYLDADLRVIHLVRDVRGVVDSTLRRGKDPLSAVQAARRWGRTNETITRTLRDMPSDRQILVRYEDLCRDVDGTLAALFDLCGVAPATTSGDFRVDQHLLGNRMRLRGRDEVRLDESWRERISDEEQRQIVHAAGAAFRHLYPDVSRPSPTVSHA